jgi:hypothetical protein
MLVLFMACMGTKNLIHSYRVTQPSHLWQKIPQTPADHAWKNPRLHSTIYVKANCGSYFEDRTLGDSILSLTRGLHVSAPINQEEIQIANRKAMFQVMDSSLDGVPLRLGMLVVSKNNCLYDFLLIAPTKYFADGVADFLNTAQSLNTNPQSKP